ncbi:Glycine cleavage system transcriptional activator [Roseovarius litorisediminis]|uniref:Glycine cleavage system transcriptional activator n=1 Tax=Roseovarius litorisediminis TaxID=1312363 RepID=A0A1Y5TEV2_9RHOB|nr:LysR family transcriptional regulator [Roseovarius litorisediminis]SLN60309.1 Glycine cleavage system transcriptional activator [Roseovarius litorisediminis]
MDWLSLPPLSALRAFVALAETGSAVAAGTKLNVSHAAISQQIKSLEAHMGLSLVNRSGRALELTSEGQQLADSLSVGFETISRTISALTGADANRPLHISTTPMFASAWLMPQLGGFHAAHPDIDLILSTTPKVEPLDTGNIDIALRYGAGNWPGLVSESLFLSPMVVVAAPSLVGERTFQSFEELAEFPWVMDAGISEANNWLSGIGTLSKMGQGSIQLPGNLLLDGARDGRGIAVAIRTFAETDIRAGRLRVLFEKNDKKGYHIVTRPGVQRPALKTFLKWLRKCARECEAPI